jgi:hypothetical protein
VVEHRVLLMQYTEWPVVRSTISFSQVNTLFMDKMTGIICKVSLSTASTSYLLEIMDHGKVNIEDNPWDLHQQMLHGFKSDGRGMIKRVDGKFLAMTSRPCNLGSVTTLRKP